MSRSVWKGPFVDGYLLKKAETSRASGRSEVIKIWSRSPICSSSASPFRRPQRSQACAVERPNEEMHRPQSWRVRPVPTTARGRQEGPRGSKMSKRNSARSEGQRGQGGSPHACTLGPEAQSRGRCPWQEGQQGSRRAREFSRGECSGAVKKTLESAIANQSRPRSEAPWSPHKMLVVTVW